VNIGPQYNETRPRKGFARSEVAHNMQVCVSTEQLLSSNESQDVSTIWQVDARTLKTSLA